MGLRLLKGTEDALVSLIQGRALCLQCPKHLVKSEKTLFRLPFIFQALLLIQPEDQQQQ